MRCIYGNALQYGLSMLKWEKMYGNASGNAFKLQWCVAFWTIHVFRVRFHNLSHLLLDIGHLQILLLLMCRFKWINFYSLSDDFIFHWCLFRQTFRANLSLSFNLFLVRNCVIANGWWCFYHYSFNKKGFLSLLASASFVERYFFFVEKTVLLLFFIWLQIVAVHTSSMISFLIFLNKSFVHLDADSTT